MKEEQYPAKTITETSFNTPTSASCRYYCTIITRFCVSRIVEDISNGNLQRGGRVEKHGVLLLI